jgi:hypothetical protein
VDWAATFFYVTVSSDSIASLLPPEAILPRADWFRANRDLMPHRYPVLYTEKLPITSGMVTRLET